ncbi:MAG: hypothetical protein ANABAC_3204 [Anaerolineae bacterium]|nr:MAG: hypothetical protein ANABAC_3204 [Anaerolineae bacterium]
MEALQADGMKGKSRMDKLGNFAQDDCREGWQNQQSEV